jgi:hypothetical protein
MIRMRPLLISPNKLWFKGPALWGKRTRKVDSDGKVNVSLGRHEGRGRRANSRRSGCSFTLSTTRRSNLPRLFWSVFGLSVFGITAESEVGVAL